MKYLWFLCVLIILKMAQTIKLSNETILMRQKRQIAFPEGATLSIAICMTSQTILQPNQLFTESINWGVSYDLPNNTRIIEDFKTHNKFTHQRRYRRDLYQKMELIMTSMGYNGKECIYKTLCETASLLNIPGQALIPEMVRVIFGYPMDDAIEQDDEDWQWQYREAHLHGRKNTGTEECASKYWKCTISLIDFALGDYSHII